VRAGSGQLAAGLQRAALNGGLDCGEQRALQSGGGQHFFPAALRVGRLGRFFFAGDELPQLLEQAPGERPGDHAGPSRPCPPSFDHGPACDHQGHDAVEPPAALAEGDRGVLTHMAPEEIQILVLAELPDVPATTGRKPITDCTREDLAFAIDDYYQAAASLSRSAAGEPGRWPDWARHLARVAAAKAELLGLLRGQMDKARGAAKVSDLWLGPMEAEFRRRRGHRGQ